MVVLVCSNSFLTLMIIILQLQYLCNVLSCVFVLEILASEISRVRYNPGPRVRTIHSRRW